MVTIAVYSILVLTLLLLLMFLELVLFYHFTSYYARRGGTSSTNEYCGIFFLFCSNIAGHTYWGSGGALSLLILKNKRVGNPTLFIFILMDQLKCLRIH